MDKNKVVDGLSLKTWEAMFRPGMHEFSASNFTFSSESETSIRIAFGNKGPYVDEVGGREAVFNCAVTLDVGMAVDLAGLLLKHFARPGKGSN